MVRDNPYNVVLTNGWLQGPTFRPRSLVRGRSAAVVSPATRDRWRHLGSGGGSLIYVSSDQTAWSPRRSSSSSSSTCARRHLCLSPRFSEARRGHDAPEGAVTCPRCSAQPPGRADASSRTTVALTRFEGERAGAVHLPAARRSTARRSPPRLRRAAGGLADPSERPVGRVTSVRARRTSPPGSGRRPRSSSSPRRARAAPTGVRNARARRERCSTRRRASARIRVVTTRGRLLRLVKPRAARQPGRARAGPGGATAAR